MFSWKRREGDFITDDWKIHYEQIKTTNLDDQPKLYTPVKSDEWNHRMDFIFEPNLDLRP